MSLSRYLSRNFALTAMISATSVLIPLAVRADPSTSPASTAKPAPTPKPESSKPDAAGAQAAPSRDDMKARMKADRDAFFSARLAALHAGLQLTADQQGLWPPVETAIRDLVTLRRSSWHRREQDKDQKAGFSIDRLTARGEHLEQMGSALKKLAAATGPLVGSLTADQKERLPMLLRGVRPGRIMARAFDLQDDRMEREGGDRAGGMRREGMDRGESRDGDRNGMDRNGMNHRGMDSSGMDSGGMDSGRMDSGRKGRGEMDREEGDYRRHRDSDGANYETFDRGDEGGEMRWHHHHRHDDEDGEGAFSRG